GDIKRGDIGSTSAAYATAHIGKVDIEGEKVEPFGEDFITVNPYFGIDGVKPFVDACKENDKGLFILVKTSNPSSGEFQDRLIDGRPLYEWVGEKVAEWGRESMSGDYSNIGAVVGATYPEMGKRLRSLMPNTFILVPGYGAQGGKGSDLVNFFNKDGLGALINSSRGIIAAYKQAGYEKFGEAGFADAAREAVIRMQADIKSALNKMEMIEMNNQLTEGDIKKMQEEIEHRKVVVRKEALEAVKEARAQGDLSENFEYYAAKREKNKNESRIRYLEKMIKTAEVYHDDTKADEIGMNSTVEVYFPEDDECETYRIVTTVREDSLNGLISVESPLGKALIGHKVGDKVEVFVNPKSSYFVEVRSISKDGDESKDKISSF
ncbi:MAG: orotidine-5'-phosphate decarboxylase, partial [Lachnospiraceae bacterium]|nr:orotidine-5'-phosphate decarboxylase [Lachnospiraceae bacterium]